MFNQIHHVAIIASDYERSKHFYVNILGMEVIRENYRAERQSYKLDLKVGTSEIELFSFPNSPERPSYPEACGLRHLCFRVEDIEQVVSYLNESGVQTQEIRVDEYTQKRYVFFNDPDGLPLELYES
ncbi:MAG: VOC family protein [Turicibacter sp.]|jgi:glyoxylase I family protein|uniref:SMU1112c/YaeR family gloxylase I-like metalloprotein n=1 Tax=unclassified Turicibacter TaxID=2638206 RepID=UPI00137A535F|nr:MULTISPECIES: VOC family protein [unclassified Turicibacter]MCI8701568.1 VOC family protein [Turicibacter sp.]MCI9350564.1 VOC family protein [Turicibacter sp.]MCU7203947.1 VOC family protein [Turicibacter sp. TA25]MCU7208587.1 VOC family protein [Turicibacter sp. 1E2]NCE77562.1 VOC family protein [Turicibacter sp. TS3]